MRKLRAMLIAYREAGGDNAVVLIYDDEHGAALIDALAQVRRRAARAGSAARRQRGHAGRPRSGRRRVRLWRIGHAVIAARAAAP